MIAPRLLRSGRVVAGGALILLVALCALFAPLLAGHDPGDQDLLNILLPPAWQHGGDPTFPLGTDSLGRDEFSRLLLARASRCSSPSPLPAARRCLGRCWHISPAILAVSSIG